jgi:hypothetical protein
VVPVEVQGDDPRGLPPNILNDGKIVIFNPLHSQVDDLSGNAMALEKVGQSQKPHGQEVDPDEMMDRPVIIGQLGNMEENKIRATHGGIVRRSRVVFQPKLKKIAKWFAEKKSNDPRVNSLHRLGVVRLAVSSSNKAMRRCDDRTMGP